MSRGLPGVITRACWWLPPEVTRARQSGQSGRIWECIKCVDDVR